MFFYPVDDYIDNYVAVNYRQANHENVFATMNLATRPMKPNMQRNLKYHFIQGPQDCGNIEMQENDCYQALGDNPDDMYDDIMPPAYCQND